jgi:hypothetical protein
MSLSVTTQRTSSPPARSASSAGTKKVEISGEPVLRRYSTSPWPRPRLASRSMRRTPQVGAERSRGGLSGGMAVSAASAGLSGRPRIGTCDSRVSCS